MDTNAKRYLELISQHLQEHHAALFVGSGFSLNADKVTSDVPDIPLWAGLAQKFKEKLGDSDQNDPLALAESVEIAYGRSELDHLLLDSIKDADYRPSPLYEKLLRLPWSDVFTTNYDTLLERAGETLVEKTFTLVTNKDDLVGSSGATRLIKLHGSFPSQRPFIITAEDYRTYPQKFAPFVNTVQQSLLENTLCMIGFSGNDPNFNNWIGWIRDNLGAENAPYLYLLSHESVSDVRREWLHRRNIIVVDLSEIFSAESPYAIYEQALDYLWNEYSEFRVTGQNWKTHHFFDEKLDRTSSIKEALPVLRKNHDSCPKVLTLSASNRIKLRHLLSTAHAILAHHCAQKDAGTENEMTYLYEYNWLNEKTLVPLLDSDIDLYQKILARNSDVRSSEKCAILFSLLRSFREYGDGENWNIKYAELVAMKAYFTAEQQEQIRWEECLHSLFRYEFQKLKQQLKKWRVSPDQTLWALRKSGLCAEVGEYDAALSLLQNSLSNLRQRISHQTRPDAFLVSLESPMMKLQSYISKVRPSGAEERNITFVDEHRRTIHRQYEVDWADENKYFTSRLEAHWVPFQTHETKPRFDFRSQWTPTEKDCTVLTAILTQCDTHHISHHGIKRYWSILLKQDFESQKDLERSLRSADTKRAHSCYNVLATTICHPDKMLLPDDELCTGLEIAAQQIAWGVPKQLAAALQTVSFAAEDRPDLLTTHSMELILTGLSQLLEQTRISSDDTVATASEKGDIRRWAVILATKIDTGKISKDGQEILKDWRAVSQDKDEFAEIRNDQR
ncbi:MAG: SIR2 family protein [Faecalibacterium prausnitzii]|nr:SIR2 family protein [Faecalibacterium prausnitzii]